MVKRTGLILILVLLTCVSAVFANGPADKYLTTVTKVEISSDGTNFTTLFEGTSSSMDIASISVGQSPGNFVSGLAVPDGTYTHVRVTPGATMTIRGNDGSGNYTLASGAPNGGCTRTTNSALKAECTVTISPAPSADTHDFSSTPITVTGGIPNRKIRVSFDVSAAIQNIAGELWPAAPTVTQTVE